MGKKSLKVSVTLMDISHPRVSEILNQLEKLGKGLVKIYYLSGWKTMCTNCDRKFYRRNKTSMLCPYCRNEKREELYELQRQNRLKRRMSKDDSTQ